MGNECPSGKDGYVSPQEAWTSITRHRMRQPTKALKAYPCPDCDMYHLRGDMRYGRERKRR